VAPQSIQRDQAMRALITETPATTTGVFSERHYSVTEVAAMWNLSKDTIRRLFVGEPGVVHLVRAAEAKPHRRPYTTLRIPQSVVERVHRRCLVVI
jgi:hypothetical protein